MEAYAFTVHAIRAVIKRVRAAFTRLYAHIDFWLSFLRNPHQLVSAWPEGEIPLGPRVAIFIHFDGAGAVGPHTLHYVRALHAAGCSVVFVTNSGHLQPDALAALQPVCAGILIRRNVGYDFGAMREGIEALNLPRPNTDSLLLANDSLYGPLGPLAPVLNRMDFAQADVWGATDSWQGRYHVQSYFVAVSRKVLESDAWRAFWAGVRPVKSKIWVVLRYELGLSQAMVHGGFGIAALWRYQDLIGKVNPVFLMHPSKDAPKNEEPMLLMRRVHAHRIRHNVAIRTPLNPTSDLWRQLLQAGFPFLKRELLRDNPSEVTDITDWRDEVRHIFGAVPEAIEHDLRRVMRNTVP
jgi:hypothetical protein